MKALREAIKDWYGHKPENEFDIVMDSTDFGDSYNPGGHCGWHTDILERFIRRPLLFKEWWQNFVREYTRVDPYKEVVRVLVCCPRGTKRAVAGAEILKYCVTSMGLIADKANRHLSDDNWNNHLVLCSQCRLHTSQKRYREVLERALQIAET